VRHLLSFARFWWDFIVGDDWLVAAGIGIGLGLTSLLARIGDDTWWFLPLAIVLVLAGSLMREVRRQRTSQATQGRS